MKSPKHIVLSGEATSKLLVDLMLALTLRGKLTKVMEFEERPIEPTESLDYVIFGKPYEGANAQEIYDRLHTVEDILDELGLI